MTSSSTPSSSSSTIEGRTCKYAFASVSIPNNEINLIDFVALFLSYEVWIIAIFLFLILLTSSSMRNKNPTFRCLGLASISSWFITEVVKQIVRQPRPAATCIGINNQNQNTADSSHSVSFGLPSSHAAVSLCWVILLMALPNYKGVTAPSSSSPSSPSNPTEDSSSSSSSSSPSQQQDLSSSTTSNIFNFNNIRSWKYFNVFRIILILSLLAVPWSRVYLNDHTVQQVCVGSLLGIAVSCSCLWFFIKRGRLVLSENNTK